MKEWSKIMVMKDILEKAKKAQSVEALIALAKENDINLSEEEAKAYFAQIHKVGELADDELDNVAGGQCKNGDKYVVIATQHCEQWKCEKCGGNCYHTYIFEQAELHDCKSTGNTRLALCNNCAYCTYERGLWLCSNTEFWENRKFIL
jgi:hypothetical protein